MDRIISSQTEKQWFEKNDEMNSQLGRPNSGAHL